MFKKLHILLIFSILVVTKPLRSNHRMRNLTAIFASINAFCYPLTYFIAEITGLFSPVIILSAGDKIRDRGFVLMKDMEKKILAVNAEMFCCHA